MTNLKWEKPEDHFFSSKCGRFDIEPNFIGRTTPQGYNIYLCSNGKRELIKKTASTKAEAKRIANKIVQQMVDAELAAYADFMDQVIVSK